MFSVRNKGGSKSCRLGARQPKVWESKFRRHQGGWVWVYPPHWGRVWERGSAPPWKIFDIFRLKMAHFHRFWSANSVFTRTWPRYVRYCKSICLSVTFMHPTQPIEIFCNVVTAFSALAIIWPCKILQRSSHGNPSTRGVKCKWGSKIERFWTHQTVKFVCSTHMIEILGHVSTHFLP